MKGGKDDLQEHQCRVEAEWMYKNGREQQFLGGEESREEACVEGQAAKPFKAPQWQNLNKQPPLPKPT